MNKGRRYVLISSFGLLSALSLMTCTPAVQEGGDLQEAPAGVSKTAVHAADKPDLSSVFNWGLKVANFSELFLVSGFAATDAEGTVLFPGDAAAQTEYVLGRVESFVNENGYSKDDIVRFEITVTRDVPLEDFQGILGVLAEFFSDVEVKPAGGTWRVIQGLISPEMLVELEFWLVQ